MKSELFFKKYKWYIIIGLIIFVLLIKLGIIPDVVNIGTFSFLGIGEVGIIVGMILLAIGIALLFIPGGQWFSPLFLVGAYVAGGSAAVSVVWNFLSKYWWVALIAFVLLILLKKK